MNENKPFKLNLGALKTNVEKIDSTEISGNEKPKNEIKTPYNTQKKSPLDKIIETELKTTEKKAHSLDLSQMKSRRIEKENKKEKKIEIIEEKEEIKEEKEVFTNYESEFKRKKQTILQRIETFKNFVSPKTRLGFISMLILITILGITSLFILSPEIHNLNNYKTNILLAKDKIECKINKTKCKKIIKEASKEKSIKKEIIDTNNKTLKKEVFVIEYKIKIVNGKEIIIYNNKDYSKEEFNKKIKEIIKQKKLDKLKKFLLNSKKEINVDIIK